MDQPKTREYYLSMVKPGNIVAFKYQDNMFSGKIHRVEGNICDIKTSNGSLYYVEKKDIVWIKNGTHWPVGVYNALKASKGS